MSYWYNLHKEASHCKSCFSALVLGLRFMHAQYLMFSCSVSGLRFLHALHLMFSCPVSGLRFLHALHLMSLVSCFRSAIPACPASHIIPRYPAVFEFAEDQHQYSSVSSFLYIHQCVAGWLRIYSFGKITQEMTSH